MKDDMVADDMVYVRRGKYWEAAKVDGFYFNCNAEQCVSFYNGPNANCRDVITYDEYWERQRAAAKALTISEAL